MPVIEFPYFKYEEHTLPIVPVSIKCEEWKDLWLFVDTGATYTVLDYKESERLNVSPEENGNKIYVRVGDGGYILIYILTLPTKIGDVEFESHIGFSKELGIGFNIMGRKDFFDKFIVCFNEKGGVIQFHTK